MYFREHMYAFQFDINAGMKLLKHRARELSSTSAAEVTIAKQFSQLLVFICIVSRDVSHVAKASNMLGQGAHSPPSFHPEAPGPPQSS